MTGVDRLLSGLWGHYTIPWDYYFDMICEGEITIECSGNFPLELCLLTYALTRGAVGLVDPEISGFGIFDAAEILES